MQIVATPDQSEDVDVEVSAPQRATLHQQPLLGLTMFLTLIVAALFWVYVGPVANALAALAMTPLMLAAMFVEDAPLTLYSALERDRERRA